MLENVSIGEAGEEYFEVSFDSEVPSDDDFDLSGPDHPYLIVQRQFEDDDGGVCYIETHDHDTYAGHFRLKLIEFTATRLAFEIARTDHKYVEVTYELDTKRFGEVQRIVHTSFLACKTEDGTRRMWLLGVMLGNAMLIAGSALTDTIGPASGI